MISRPRKQTAYRREIYPRAIRDSLLKLDPRVEVRNPVMFVVEVGSLLTTVLWVQALLGHGEAPAGFIGAVALWLWFTVLFANFAEAVAEGRGKAQAEALRKARRDTPAKRLRGKARALETARAALEIVSSTQLHKDRRGHRLGRRERCHRRERTRDP
jgi:K+-transporting ATPase ATPase B chain